MRTVYALAEGRHIRYVGVSRRPASRVPSLRASKTPVGDWLRNIKAHGKYPRLLLLEDVEEKHAFDREAHWIRHYRDRRAKLFNLQERVAGQFRVINMVRDCAEYLSEVSRRKRIPLGDAAEVLTRHWFRRLGKRYSSSAFVIAWTSKKRKKVGLTLTDETVRMIRLQEKFDRCSIGKALSIIIYEVGTREERRSEKSVRTKRLEYPPSLEVDMAAGDR